MLGNFVGDIQTTLAIGTVAPSRGFARNIMNPADEDRIAELLIRWEEAFDHGQDLAAEEISASSSMSPTPSISPINRALFIGTSSPATSFSTAKIIRSSPISASPQTPKTSLTVIRFRQAHCPTWLPNKW